MQLDIDVSPPANIMGLRLTLTHVTFDLDPSDLWPRLMILDQDQISSKTTKSGKNESFWPDDLDLWSMTLTF